MTRRTVAISGASGLIGRHLARALRAEGDRVLRLVRDPDRAGGDAVWWDPVGGRVDTARLEGVDAVIHLAGEPIGERRWTAAQKRRIWDSRVQGTRVLAEALASLDRPPEVLVSASAVGIYGDRGDEELTEASPPGRDFLAQLAVAWEQAATPAAEAGIRVVHPRTGLVLAADAPAVRTLVRPFRLGLGGPVGSGRQWVSWIDITDHVRAVRFLLDHRELAGPVNFTSPVPVTNAELARALGYVLGRPTLLRVPAWAIRLLFGEMGVALVLASQRVLPERLLGAGFRFEVTDVRDALRRAVARR